MVIELNHDDQAQLKQFAETSQRSESEVVSEALHRYFAAEEALDAKIARAREQARNGQTVSHEEVGRRLKKRFGW